MQTMYQIWFLRNLHAICARFWTNDLYYLALRWYFCVFCWNKLVHSWKRNIKQFKQWHHAFNVLMAGRGMYSNRCAHIVFKSCFVLNWSWINFSQVTWNRQKFVWSFGSRIMNGSSVFSMIRNFLSWIISGNISVVIKKMWSQALPLFYLFIHFCPASLYFEMTETWNQVCTYY